MRRAQAPATGGERRQEHGRGRTPESVYSPTAGDTSYETIVLMRTCRATCHMYMDMYPGIPTRGRPLPPPCSVHTTHPTYQVIGRDEARVRISLSIGSKYEIG